MELLPCPFCGSEDISQSEINGYKSYFCTYCVRELKFRLFNKKICKYVNSDDYIIYFNGSLYSTFFCQFKTVEESNFVIEQYTGRKDALGLEIYESDIVICHKENEQYSSKGIIKFEEEWCAFYINDNNRNPLICDLSMNSIAIIGNIHENPELLENK